MLIFASTPLQAQAGLLSLFFGGDAYANTTPALIDLNDSNQTLGNMALLQANVPFDLIAEDKTAKKDDAIDPDANVDIVSSNALLPPTGPMGVYDDKNTNSEPYSGDISVYVVRTGDSISQIAQMFNVSVNTILWANDMKKEDKLIPGSVLLILPVSGLEHIVTKGQTLQSIVKLYKADLSEVAGYNGIATNTTLAVGDKLLIPGGTKAAEGNKPIQNLNASIAKDKKYYESHPVQNLSGYYINPVPGYRKSQGIHDKNAVDLAIASGTPIRAAAAGKVTLARIGYNGGFGNLVIISHPNGTETLYAHQSKIATVTGAQVSQGETIGYVGSTGRSTGPHLHFEVHGARNPGADGSWKY